jgi:uncharacterized membrane protein
MNASTSRELHSGLESDATALSRGLGWFSIALEMTGLAIPKKLARAIDVVASHHAHRAHDQGHRIASFSLTIDRSPAEVYAFYRRLSLLPLFMNYLALVREADATYSHWLAKLPGGDTVSWDTKIVEDRPGELIAWRSVEGSLVKIHGQVSFVGIGEGNATEVRVELQLESLGNKPSKGLATFFTDAQLEGDLGRLKELIESGSVPPAVAYAAS